jgi:AcrR family transcriptional regulator
MLVSVPEDRGEFGPLPAGTHGFTSEQVAYNQRERILAAVAELVAEQGYPSLTVSKITKLARVSRRTFYEQFEDREDCFLAAFNIVVDHLHRLIDQAVEPVAGWPQKVAVGLAEILSFFVSEPQLAKIAMVDALTAGPTVAERYQEVVVGFGPFLRPGRKQHKAKGDLPDSTEDTIVGSIASVITREILAGRTAELESLHEDFVIFALTPYLGPKRAQKVAGKAGPAPTR